MNELIRLETVAPIELLRLPADLNGEHGANRSAARAQIAAQNDVDAIKAWLARFVDTPTTFSNYRKESERLLLWSVCERGKPISSLTHEDLLAYKKFIADPQPPMRWIMKRGRKWPRSHPDWRPFACPLSPTSQRQAMIILNVMFSWLVTAGYLAGNPLSLSRMRKPKAKPRVTRLLGVDVWNEVKATIQAMPRESDREREHYARVRWLFSLMYICSLRISEVTGNTMSGFFVSRKKDGKERWWLEITGKGDKTRDVPATAELMVELARYRAEYALAPIPLPGEVTPLLLPIGGKLKPMTRSAVHMIVKEVFRRAAKRVRARENPGDDNLAALLEEASAHWVRHTAGTDMANADMDVRHVRDNFGHQSISTTNQYLHTEDDHRHDETEQKHRMGW